MLGRREANPDSGQLRWAVLLLSGVVILPTVCLLWFMGTVVGNEHLVIRQKLVTLYQRQLARTIRQIDERCSHHFDPLESTGPDVRPYEMLLAAVTHDRCDGLVIYDAAGERRYPLLSTDVDARTRTREIFRHAWELEFDFHILFPVYGRDPPAFKSSGYPIVYLGKHVIAKVAFQLFPFAIIE